MSPVLKVLYRNVDIPLRYLCFCKFWSLHTTICAHFDWLKKQALFSRFCAVMLISCWDIYAFISFDHSIPLLGLILTNSEKEPLFWRFHAEMMISLWDIYLFVIFDHSIPLFGLILSDSKKRALFWRFHAETLISHWDIYVFVSFNHSIPLFGFIFDRLREMGPVLNVSCRNIDILLRYLCFCKSRS